MTDKELVKLARFNNYPEEHMDLLVQWGRRVLMARRQFDLELQTENIRAAVRKEREECAKVCEGMPLEWQAQPQFARIELLTARDCAAAIRARGEA